MAKKEAAKQKKTTKPNYTEKAFVVKTTIGKLPCEARFYNTKGDDVQFINLTFCRAVAVRGVKVVNGKNGPFVSFPSYKDEEGEYHEYIFPITAEARESLCGKLVKYSVFGDAAPQEDEDDEDDETPFED